MADSIRQSNGPDPDRVARRAYEIFESRGREHGGDQDDWLRAEQEVSQSAAGISNRETPAEEAEERRDHPPRS